MLRSTWTNVRFHFQVWNGQYGIFTSGHHSISKMWHLQWSLHVPDSHFSFGKYSLIPCTKEVEIAIVMTSIGVFFYSNFDTSFNNSKLCIGCECSGILEPDVTIKKDSRQQEWWVRKVLLLAQRSVSQTVGRNPLGRCKSLYEITPGCFDYFLQVQSYNCTTVTMMLGLKGALEICHPQKKINNHSLKAMIVDYMKHWHNTIFTTIVKLSVRKSKPKQQTLWLYICPKISLEKQSFNKRCTKCGLDHSTCRKKIYI